MFKRRTCSNTMFHCCNTVRFVCRKWRHDKTHSAGNIATPGILPPGASSGNVLTQLATRWQQFNPHFRRGARTPHAQEEETWVVSLPSDAPHLLASGKVKVITTECFAKEDTWRFRSSYTWCSSRYTAWKKLGEIGHVQLKLLVLVNRRFITIAVYQQITPLSRLLYTLSTECQVQDKRVSETLHPSTFSPRTIIYNNNSNNNNLEFINTRYQIGSLFEVLFFFWSHGKCKEKSDRARRDSGQQVSVRELIQAGSSTTTPLSLGRWQWHIQRTPSNRTLSCTALDCVRTFKGLGLTF